jgi:hypothetical protein
MRCAHTLRNVRRLTLNRGQNGASLTIDTVTRVGVADRADRAARDAGQVDVGRRRDFASHQAEPGGNEDFTGHAAVGILHQDRVQYSIADLVGDFVGMTFGNRFRGEEVSTHERVSWRAVLSGRIHRYGGIRHRICELDH